ncbi:MAG: RodZ domain-containing protein [Gallionella sp.]
MMEHIPEKNLAQTDKSDAITEATLGAVLREAREHLGLSVADVANQIKFAPRQIEAIEAGDYQHLPEEAFLRGFIRSYAKILQLDAQKLLAALPHSKMATMELVVPPSVGVPFPNTHSLPRQNTNLLVAAAVLAVIAGVFALWNSISPIKHQKVAQVETPVTLPTEDQTVPVPPAPDGQVKEPAATDASKAKNKPESVQPETKPQTKTLSKPETKSETKPVAKQEVKSVEMLGLNPEVKPADKPKAMPVTRPEAKLEVEPEITQEVKPETKPEVKPEITQEAKPEAKPVTPQQSMPATSETQPGDSTKVTQIRIEFGEESWTEIRDKDDKIISSKVNPAGSELVVYGRAPFTMLIGHGLAARLYHEGKQVDLTPYINKYSEVAHVTLK